MSLERGLFASIALCGAVLCVVVLAVGGTRAGISTGVGAAIALLNLWALRSILAILVSAAAGTRSSAGYGFFLVPKLIALLGIVWLLLVRHLVSAGPLAIGYGALPIGVAIGALVCKKGDT